MNFRAIAPRLCNSYFTANNTKRFRTWSIVNKKFDEKLQTEGVIKSNEIPEVGAKLTLANKTKISNEKNGGQRLKMVAICPPMEPPTAVKLPQNDQVQLSQNDQVPSSIGFLFFLVKIGIVGGAVWWMTNEGVWGDAREAEIFWNRWISIIHMKLSKEKYMQMPPDCLSLQPNPPTEVMKDGIVCYFNQFIKKITQG